MNINQLMQPIVLLLLMLICIESPPNEQTESNSDTEE